MIEATHVTNALIMRRSNVDTLDWIKKEILAYGLPDGLARTSTFWGVMPCA